jgi:hypothetical protein
MKLHDMQRSDREKKAIAEDRTTILPMHAIAGDYPEGLRICLDDDTLKKLGVDPQHGEHYAFHGEAHVTGRQQEDTDKGSDRRVNMTFHKLGAEKVRGAPEREKSVREDLEDARHRARGTLSPSIGARALGGRNGGGATR